MAFPPELLTDDEDLVLDLRPHWWFFVKSVAVLGVFVLIALIATAGDWPDAFKTIIGAAVLFQLVWVGVRYFVWTTINFVVTSERVISRSGVIRKTGIEIPLDRINTVFFEQRLVERMIGAGDLGIESAGEGGRQTFTNIRRPNQVQAEIYRQVEGHEDRKLHRMGQAVSGAAAPPPPAPAPVADTVPEQIDKLDRLRRQGALTEEEFQQKKRDLLDRM